MLRSAINFTSRNLNLANKNLHRQFSHNEKISTFSSLQWGENDPSKGNCGIAVLVKHKQSDKQISPKFILNALASVSRRGSTYSTQNARFGGDGIGASLIMSPENMAKYCYELADVETFVKSGFSVQCAVPDNAQDRLTGLATSLVKKFPHLEFSHQFDHLTDYSKLTQVYQYRLGNRSDLIFYSQEKDNPEFVKEFDRQITLFNTSQRLELQNSLAENKVQKPIEVLGSGDSYIMFKSFAHSPLNNFTIFDQFPNSKKYLAHLDAFVSQSRKSTGSSVRRGSIQPFGGFNSLFLVNGEMNNKRKLINPLIQALGLEPTKENKELLFQLSDTALQSISFQLGLLDPQKLTCTWRDYKYNSADIGNTIQQGPLTFVYYKNNEIIMGRDPNGGRPAYLNKNDNFIGLGSVLMPLKDAEDIYIKPGQTLKINHNSEIKFSESGALKEPISWLLPSGKHVSTKDNRLPELVSVLKYPEDQKTNSQLFKKLQAKDPRDMVTAMGHQGQDSILKANIAGVTNEAYDGQLHPMCTRTKLLAETNQPPTYSPSPFITKSQIDAIQGSSKSMILKMLIKQTHITDEAVRIFLNSIQDQLHHQLQKSKPSVIILDFLPNSEQETPLSPLPLGVAKVFQLVEHLDIPIILKAIPTGIETDSFNEVLFAFMSGANAIYNPTITQADQFYALNETLRAGLGRTGIPILSQTIGSGGYSSTIKELAEHLSVNHNPGVDSSSSLSTSTLYTHQLLQGTPPDLGKKDTSEQQYLTQAIAVRAQEGEAGMKDAHRQFDAKDPLASQFDFIKQFKPKDLAVAIIGGGAASLTATEQALEKTIGPVDILVRSPKDFPGSLIYPAEDHVEIITGTLERMKAILQEPRVRVIQVETEKFNQISSYYNTVIDTRYQDVDTSNSVQKFFDFARNGHTTDFFNGQLQSPLVFFTGGFGNVFDDVIKLFKQEEEISQEFLNYVGKYPTLSLNALIRKSPEDLFYKAVNEENLEFLTRIRTLQEKFPDQFSWYASKKPTDSKILELLGEENFKEDLKDFKPGINLVFNASGKYEKDHVIVNGHMITNSIGFPAYVQNIGGEFYQIDKSPFTNVQNHGWKNKTGSVKELGEHSANLHFATPQELTDNNITYNEFKTKRTQREKLDEYEIKPYVISRLDSFSRYPSTKVYPYNENSAQAPVSPLEDTLIQEKAIEELTLDEHIETKINAEKPNYPNHFAFVDKHGKVHWVEKEAGKSVYIKVKELGLHSTTSCDNTQLTSPPSCSECGGHINTSIKLPRSAAVLKPKEQIGSLFATLGCLTPADGLEMFVHRDYIQGRK